LELFKYDLGIMIANWAISTLLMTLSAHF